MTIEEKIDFIRDNSRYPISEDPSGFGALLLPVFCFVISFFLLHEGIINKVLSMVFIGCIILILGLVMILLIVYLVKYNLKFYFVTTGLSKEENVRHAKDILVKDFNLKPEKIVNQSGLVVGERPSLDDYSILCGENYVLIHSRSIHPTKPYQIKINKDDIYKIEREFLKRKQQTN